MSKKVLYQSYGFGFDPKETKHHFVVIIPKSKKEKVKVFERFNWTGESELTTINDKPSMDNRLKVEIPYAVWERVKSPLSQEFNTRLKREGYKQGTWKVGNNPVHRLLGKEMVLLLWAVEDIKNADDDRILKAVINWRGLRPEERWFLFDLTNAATGSVSDRTGWRMGIKWGLLENPVDEYEVQQLEFTTREGEKDNG